MLISLFFVVNRIINPNWSLEFELIFVFMANRLIRHFPEGIAGYVERKGVLRYRQKPENSQIVWYLGQTQNPLLHIKRIRGEKLAFTEY